MTRRDFSLLETAGLRLALLTVSALSLAGSSFANDWPEWRGEGRNGVWTETGIISELPAELRVKWRVPVNGGFSGPAVADGRVFLTDWAEDPESRTMDGIERAIAIDEETGDMHDLSGSIDIPLSKIPYEKLNPGKETLEKLMDRYR